MLKNDNCSTGGSFSILAGEKIEDRQSSPALTFFASFLGQAKKRRKRKIEDLSSALRFIQDEKRNLDPMNSCDYKMMQRVFLPAKYLM